MVRIALANLAGRHRAGRGRPSFETAAQAPAPAIAPRPAPAAAQAELKQRS